MTNPLTILYEDKQIIVCVKPAGVATQSKRISSPDMVSLLKNHIRTESGVSGDPYLAVIHRLDQPVSGILVFAKTPQAAKELNRQLQSSGFGKFYRALVANVPAKPSADLENYLVKDGRTNTSRICDKNTPDAKSARLHYTVVDSPKTWFFADAAQKFCTSGTDTSLPDPQDTKLPKASSICTELEVHLDTGRHHQIRVQLAGIGCPIIGDSKYNPAFSSSGASAAIRLPLCLCAYQLDFTHPQTKKPMHFELTKPA